MQVRVVFYGGLQRVVGSRDISLNLPAQILNLQKLSEYLIERTPELMPHLQSVVFAVDNQIVPSNSQIQDGNEIALLPPVSGG
ncbi:MoaD/ThiS family protein [Candidatus Acetothermia bacterium]|nr:MoaD/ThiS family protein [Candidatus Acetothermia bacterium]MBI3644161.1 MoaD/ThiS family protein [Candidatus Acetothermia bacterium]